jgi:capping protein alpha
MWEDPYANGGEAEEPAPGYGDGPLETEGEAEIPVDPQQLEIATRLLTEAPPGEFDDCHKALSQFVTDPNIVERAKKVALPNWMQAQCLTVEVEGKRAIICNEARLEDGRFVDPNTMRPFTFDFRSRKVVSIESYPIDSSPLRGVLQSAVEKFAAASIRNGRCAVYDAAEGYTIVISGSSISKENFRTGSLVMRFTLTRRGRIQGSIRLREHFYENGNSVAEQASQFDETVGVGSDDETAVNVVKKIGTFYTNWTTSLQKAFDLLASEGLERLRRRLPITKTHINWRQEIIGAASMPVGRK